LGQGGFDGGEQGGIVRRGVRREALQYRAVAANQNFSKFHSTSPACLGKQLYWPSFSTKSLAAGKVALGWAAISRA
jgi:hypothetical protein